MSDSAPAFPHLISARNKSQEITFRLLHWRHAPGSMGIDAASSRLKRVEGACKPARCSINCRPAASARTRHLSSSRLSQCNFPRGRSCSTDIHFTVRNLTVVINETIHWGANRFCSVMPFKPLLAQHCARQDHGACIEAPAPGAFLAKSREVLDNRSKGSPKVTADDPVVLPGRSPLGPRPLAGQALGNLC